MAHSPNTSCAPERLLAHKPQNVSFEEAAATPVVGFTAIQGLRDTGQIEAGQKVLINGASGGIGTFAVQYAKSLGVEVTGVCSTGNLEMVRSIGADHVFDYTQEDFTRAPQKYDLVFDTIGNLSVAELERTLAPNGRAVVAGFKGFRRMFEVLTLGAWLTRRTDKFVGMMPVAKAIKDDLRLIAELLESRQVVPVIDRCYSLAETPDALAYLEKGHAKGKVIVMVEPK